MHGSRVNQTVGYSHTQNLGLSLSGSLLANIPTTPCFLELMVALNSVYWFFKEDQFQLLYLCFGQPTWHRQGHAFWLKTTPTNRCTHTQKGENHQMLFPFSKYGLSFKMCLYLFTLKPLDSFFLNIFILVFRIVIYRRISLI